MRRLLLLFFVFLAIGVGLALVFREHNGYVLIAYANWRLETSLFFLVCAVVAAFWLLVVLWRLTVAGIWLPSNLRSLVVRRRANKAERSLSRGLMLLYEGRWGDAEQELARLAERSRKPAINYLSAARAAQQQHALKRRDRYLERAAAGGDAEFAVLLSQAEMQMVEDQDAEALASLTRLREIEPAHPRVLTLLADLCERLEDWTQLRGILDLLHKADAVSQTRWRELATAAWGDLLDNTESNTEALTTAWRKLPRALRQQSTLQCRYAKRLRDIGAHDEAANLIQSSLKHDWNADLVLIFGELETDNRTRQLATTEAWLKQYGEEPELLLVAGRLCLRDQLWGRARSYFEQVLASASRPQALVELGRLFEQIDQQDDALQAYRQGLEHLTAQES